MAGGYTASCLATQALTGHHCEGRRGHEPFRVNSDTWDHAAPSVGSYWSTVGGTVTTGRPVVHRSPIFPDRIDVTAVNDGTVLAVHDHPTRQPIEVIGLTTDQATKLMQDLADALGFDLRKKD